MEVSPDGVIKCVRNCRNCNNIMQVPVGTMALELKCPYTPITDKKLLPVQYHPPHYNCCQLLSQMMATGTQFMIFGSCSLESMAISFVDKCEDTWKPLWGLACELYADGHLTKPTTLHGQSTDLRLSLKQYSEAKSTFVAEIPILTGVNNHLERRHMPNDVHQFVPSISSEFVDGEDVNKEIFDLCQESYKAVHKAYNLQRRKASEVLLFVCTDSDREFNKDKPTSIPIAYALKGRSIRISTARKMINIVRDKLKDNGTTILCESVDGQWSGIVFRDEKLRPLTLFELQRDCWLKFAKMSKEKIVQFIQDISYVSYDDKQSCSQIDIDYFATHRYGNIEVHIEPHRRQEDGVVVRRIFVNSYAGYYNQGSVLHLLKTPTKSNRPDLWEAHLGVHNNLLQVIGLIMHTGKRSARIPSVPDASDAESGDEDDDVLNLRADIVDESDRTPPTATASPDDGRSIHVSAADIRAVLLGSHKYLLEDILIALLCSPNSVKWSSYNCKELYDFAFSSAHAIYSAMTIHELDITINVLRKWECKKFPLGIKLNASKVKKVNQLGYILGHTDFITPNRAAPKMKPLLELALDEAKHFVPSDVLRVALATFEFRIKLPLWMDKSSVPISYAIPVEPHNFDVFSYPEFNLKRQQLEPRIIDPSHVLTNLRVHATQKGILGCDPKAFLRVSEHDNNILS